MFRRPRARSADDRAGRAPRAAARLPHGIRGCRCGVDGDPPPPSPVGLMRALSPELGAVVGPLVEIAGLAGPAVSIARGAVDWDRWLDVVFEHQLAALFASRRFVAPQ